MELLSMLLEKGGAKGSAEKGRESVAIVQNSDNIYKNRNLVRALRDWTTS